MKVAVTNRDSSPQVWPLPSIPRESSVPSSSVGGPEEPSSTNLVSEFVHQAIDALRRRWGIAIVGFLAVLAPIATWAVLSVPTYAASGTVQASAQESGMTSLLELADAGGGSEIETEVEIIKRREMVLEVLKDLRLDVVDPEEPRSVTTDLAIALRGKSPVSAGLLRARQAITRVEVDPYRVAELPLVLTGVDERSFEVVIGDTGAERSHVVEAGGALVDEAATVAFSELPVDPGVSIRLVLVPDGRLLEDAMERIHVSAVGNARKTTNLVEVSFTHVDRDIARSVVQGLMQRYLDQSLQWQKLSASNASDFIAQQLELARERLKVEEDELRKFAEAERAVQLDVQAKVTIESTAALEAERLQLEMQERAIGGVMAGMKRRTTGQGASLTANFIEDPILATNVAALTENETKLAVLRATLTEDHPQIHVLEAQVELQRGEVAGLVRTAKKSLTSRRSKLDEEIKSAMGALATYPEKEMQLARHMRDVEVNQRLYAFLLEKLQEAEILEASTTTDKRIVEAAALPHQKASPKRGKLIFSGAIVGLMFAFAAVYCAHALQRRIDTVKDLKALVPYPVYGTVPGVEGSRGDRLAPTAVWGDKHGPAAEAFRALAASVSLSPAAPGRGRIIQVTSSQPGEGKSTVIANLAVALSKAGAKVILIDLDLRRPVQHRGFSLRRGPGYADLVSQGSDPSQMPALLQRTELAALEILTAGSKLPDTLGAVMTPALPGLLGYCSKHYDYVLVDSPPAFVPDTSMVARHADLLLVVGRPGSAERGGTRQAVDLLRRVDVAKGLVLNGVTRSQSEYEYRSGYYSYGQHYGEQADAELRKAG
jgi:capsular exopolysaccharide synthesis family protein